MAKSRFEYVKHFERDDRLLPQCWLVIRVDGDKFSNFVQCHGFAKPNDLRGLALMRDCAERVMFKWGEVILSYGHSDEFSFLLPASCTLYGRRASKLASSLAALFSATYVFRWGAHFPDTPLQEPPSFDGRVVEYPSAKAVRDYFSWRQADCHINNLYNTAFWALVNGAGMTGRSAEEALRGTCASEKQELLFSRFGINYNDEPALARKGVVIWREKRREGGDSSHSVRFDSIDIIQNSFWDARGLLPSA